MRPTTGVGMRGARRRPARIRSFGLGLALLATAGCSLVNPYVVGTKTRQLAWQGTPEPVMDLARARHYAELVKDEYRKALGDQAQFQAWLGLALIPLSAAAIGLGATGGPPTAVIATGLTGAASFGAGTWLVNRPRQLAYAAGLKAVTCAVDAVEPLGEIDAATLEASVATLRTEIPNLRRQLAILAPLGDELERELRRFGGDAVAGHQKAVREAKAEVALASALVASAEAAASSGAELHRMVQASGQRLNLAVAKIVDTVDEIVVNTQRDPAALAAIINSLGSTYKTLTTVPEGVKPAAESQAQGAARALSIREQDPPDAQARSRLDALAQEVVRQTTDLRLRSTVVDAARRRVATEVNHVDVAAVVKKLDGCGVKTGDIVTGLTVEPPPPFVMDKGDTTGFTAKGGVPPYHASVSGPGGNKVLATPAALQSAAFIVTAATDAPAGTYVVTVSDSSGQVKQVTLKVNASEPPADPAPAPADKLKPQDAAAFIEKLKNKVVPIKAAGIWARVGEMKAGDTAVVVPLTVERVLGFKPEAVTADVIIDELRSVTGTGLSKKQITVDVADLAKKATAFEASRAGACAAITPESAVATDAEPLFTELKPDERKKLQRALCAVDDGTWGKETKQKLKESQCATGRMPDGKLSPDLRTELLALTPETIVKRCKKP